MKKILLLAAAALISTAATAQTKFLETSFAAVAKEATAGKKLIFMDIYTTWCGPCKYLTANIFPAQSVGDYMNATFVNTKFDAEKGEGIALAQKYKVTAYPTMLILNTKGEELGRLVGGSQTPDEFLKRVKDEVAKVNAKQ